jgi:hypothetical protein
MRNGSWLAVGLICVFAWRSEAQPVPLTITCSDSSGRPVPPAQVTNGTIAKAMIDREGRRVIEYDPRSIDGISSQQQLFVYAHECGHHALGHDFRQPFNISQEQDADCSGVRSLINRYGFTDYSIGILQATMRDLTPAYARDLPWRPRLYNLEDCLPSVISARAAASGRAETSADSCVLHNDGENAILSKSRDGRSIDATYSVGNRCTRDLNCTFTTEIGTLPDVDADVGSWRGFRAQKTITDQHRLGPMAPKAEFRFHATVDAIPTGESVDFRVITSCR